MRLKLYRAASVAEAMAQVRAELGPEALIVSNRRMAQGVELTAALEQDDELPEPVVPSAAADFCHVSSAAADFCHVSSAATDLCHVLSAAADLSHHGIPGPILSRLAGCDTLGALASALAAHLRFAALPLDQAACGPGRRPLLLAGMPGAGKTLSVARLATRLVLGGVRPVVITADGRRAGAAEELAAYTRLLGINLMVASTPATLARAIASADEAAPVLIDTAGISPFDEGEVAAIAALSTAAGAISLLVMQAGLHPEEAAEQAQAFSPVGARHLLATRLDLTRRLGSVVAAALSGGLALTEAGIGPGVTDTLVPLTPDFLAGRLLLARRPTPLSDLPEAGLKRPVFPAAKAVAAHAWST